MVLDAYHSQPRGLLELKCGSEGLKTAKITINRSADIYISVGNI